MGRPTKLTPEVQAVIIEAVEAGNYFETAAALAKICKQTLYSWIEKGEAGEEPYAAFLDALKGAEAKAEQDALRDVREAQVGWQAHMTFLERRHPTRWGRRDPDYSLKTKLLEAELATANAKLKLLEAGQDPDAQQITVVVPSFRDES